MKTVSFNTPKKAADSFVNSAKPTDREAKPKVEMMRFTIDVPKDLHTAIKLECVRRGKKMADVLRELFEREFRPAKGNQ